MRLRLSGWSRERRVVLVRETPAIAPVGENARRRRDTFAPALPGTAGWTSCPAPWAGRIAVLVTTLDESACPAVALARLCRERADAENICGKLKNQWGLVRVAGRLCARPSGCLSAGYLAPLDSPRRNSRRAGSWPT